MKPLRISINQLARDLDVPPNRIGAIVNGKHSITADTALRLGTYFRVSPETWRGLQTDYDLRLTRQRYGSPPWTHLELLRRKSTSARTESTGLFRMAS